MATPGFSPWGWGASRVRVRAGVNAGMAQARLIAQDTAARDSGSVPRTPVEGYSHAVISFPDDAARQLLPILGHDQVEATCDRNSFDWIRKLDRFELLMAANTKLAAAIAEALLSAQK